MVVFLALFTKEFGPFGPMARLQIYLLKLDVTHQIDLTNECDQKTRHFLG